MTSLLMEPASTVIIVDIVRGRSGAPQPGGEVKGAFLVLQAAHGEAGHIALGCLLGHILQLIPGGGSLAASVRKHILVVEQGQAVAAKGKAVKLVVQLAGVQRALIILVDPIPIADLVADIREDSHGRVRGVVRAVDDYQVGKLRRAGSDGQLLFKVGKGDIFC